MTPIDARPAPIYHAQFKISRSIAARTTWRGQIDITSLPITEAGVSLPLATVLDVNMPSVAGLEFQHLKFLDRTESKPVYDIVRRIWVTVTNTTNAAIVLDNAVVTVMGELAAITPRGFTRTPLGSLTPAANGWTVTSLAGVPLAARWDSYLQSAGVRNYKGSWNANTNSPTLTSGVGTVGDTYVVSVAGSTTLDGISSWAVGDEASFNGTAWQKIPLNTGAFLVANNLSEGNPVTMRTNLLLKSFATKDDKAVGIDLEGLSGTRNLTSTEVAYQILYVYGKPSGDVVLKFPADTEGTWTFVNETTGGYAVTVENVGGQLGAIAIAKRPGADEVFVLNQTSETISVLDSDLGTILRTLTPSSLGAAQDMAFSPDGSVLYLTVPVDSSSGLVKLIDPEDGTSAGTSLTTPAAPRGVLVDQTNDAIWVSCNGTSVQLRRFQLSTGSTVATVTPEDPDGPLGNSYGAFGMALSTDGATLFFFGRSGRGHSGTGNRYAFAFDTSDNSYEAFAVGNKNNSGGLAVNDDAVFISYGGRSLPYYDVTSPFALQGTLSVGNKADWLLIIDDVLYASNHDDKTLSVYSTVDFEEADLIALDYAPGQLINNGSDLIWAVLPDNNAVGLINPATGNMERRVALGPLAPLVLEDGVTEVASNGTALWSLSDQAMGDEVLGNLLPFDPQPWFEAGILDLAQTPWEIFSAQEYAASASTQVPYPRVIKTVGTQFDQLGTVYIAVRRGSQIHFEAWVMRPIGATGTAGVFQLQINQFDKNHRPADTTPVNILSYTPAADGVWVHLEADYVLPLTHTVVGNSDGGPVCYLKVLITVNKAGSGTPIMQELQWGSILVDYANTARTQTLYANAATADATVQCGPDSFTAPKDATAAEMQDNIRATTGNENVVVTGASTEGDPGEWTGSWDFTWPPGITPPPLVILTPDDDTWTIRRNTGSGDAVSIQGIPVAETTPTDGQVLVFNNGTGQYEPEDQSGSGGVELVVEPYTGDGDAIEVTDEAGDDLADVALSGDYNDLINTPSLATVATSGDYNDLDNTPVLADVATSGDYGDLTGTPDFGDAAFKDTGTGSGEVAAGNHTHDAAAIISGTLDPARIPILPMQTVVISPGGIADLTGTETALISQGVTVTTTDGRRWVYKGSGSKTSEASYIEMADVTPEWSVIANKPAKLTSFLGLTWAADTYAYFTDASTAAIGTISADARTLLAAANFAAQRTALGLGDSATKNVGTSAGTVAAGDHNHTGVYAPINSPALTGTPTVPTASAGTNNTQAASTAYADGAVATLSGTVTSALAGKAALASDNDLSGVNRFEKGQRQDASSPTQITANQNNYDAGTAPVARVYSDASRDITGLANPSDGRELTLTNVGSFNLVFKNESASSTAANRLALPNSNDVTLTPNSSITFWYDNTSTRWRMAARGVGYGTTAGTFAAGDHTHSIYAVLATDNDMAGVNRFEQGQRQDASSPSQITSNQDNYNAGTAPVARLSTDAARDITGIVTAADGRELTLTNVGSNNIVLKHENAGSTAGNRFALPNSADVTLVANSSVTLWYDNTTQRWRVQSRGIGFGTTAGTFAAGNHTQAASTISDSTTAGRTLLTAADDAAQRLALALFMNYGDGSDGNVTISGTTTLTRDMYYNDLTVQSGGGVLVTAGFKVHVRGTLSGAGIIRVLVAAGNNASGATGGAATTAPGITTTGFFGVANAGANGSTGAGVAASNLAAQNVAGGVAGATSAAGGSGSGGSGGSGRTGVTGTAYSPRSVMAQFGLSSNTTFSLLRGGHGGSAGGSGGGDGSNSGGGGGAGGTGGGILWIGAKTWSFTGTVEAKGGAGGNGATPSTGNCGGGGGGGGGAGGFIYGLTEIYNAGATFDVSGGAAGTSGSGVGSGTAGGAASAGGTGRYIVLRGTTGESHATNF